MSSEVIIDTVNASTKLGNNISDAYVPGSSYHGDWRFNPTTFQNKAAHHVIPNASAQKI